MKAIISFIQYYKSVISVLVVALLVYLFLGYSGERQEKRIEAAQEKIERQIRLQDSLLRKVDSLSVELKHSGQRLAQLQAQDGEYLNRIAALNQSISKLNTQYEKAFSFVEHYTTDSIRQYFSNLK